MNDFRNRYHGVSIGLHWLIAVLIIGMLIMGKFMTSLAETDSLRFAIIQWHKSIGIMVMILVAIRLLWRITHRPPPATTELKPWEKSAAHIAHIALYLLMICIPISGWIMVSASPLNLPTVIFDIIHWPHLPPFDSLSNKEELSSLFITVHEILGSLLIVVLLVHAGAALRHHFVLHDSVMFRMSPLSHDGSWVPGIAPFLGAVTFTVVALVAYGYSFDKSTPLGAGSSNVGFTFSVLGQEAEGAFSESTVELNLDPDNLADSSISATVNTASVSTNNTQLDSALPATDWFDVKTYPQATFVSNALKSGDDNEIIVTGMLTIKGGTKELNFPLNIIDEDNKRIATGAFTINRLDFGIGSFDQPDDKTVGYNVNIAFRFDLK